MMPGLTHDEPWWHAAMTHETMLVEETLDTQNGHGEVTVGVALGVAPAVRLTFTGRHAPSVTFEYAEPADALSIGRALIRAARAAGASTGTEAG
jgi:hypothetical protein